MSIIYKQWTSINDTFPINEAVICTFPVIYLWSVERFDVYVYVHLLFATIRMIRCARTEVDISAQS